MALYTRLTPLRPFSSRALSFPTPPRALSFSKSRNGSTAPTKLETSHSPSEQPLNPRWLSDLKARIKRIQGSSPDKASRADILLRDTESRWLDLLAGPDGFITSPEWRALDGREIIWGDIDSMYLTRVGHVNNLVYNRLAESGRVNWVRLHGEGANPSEARSWSELMTPLSVGLILKSINTIFKFPMTFPDRATVLFKLANRPDFSSDSLDLEAAVFSEKHQRLAARCIETTVIYDYRRGEKTVLPAFMVEKFRKTYDRQVKARRHYYRQAQEVIHAVQELEGDTRA